MSPTAFHDLAVLLSGAASELLPPGKAPVTSLAFDWRPSVISVGAPLASGDRRIIEKSGLLRQLARLDDALLALNEGHWDAVVVAPTVAAESDGVRFVKALKVPTALSGNAEALARLAIIRAQCRRTAFIIRPLPGDVQFAVFQSATRWYLEDERRVTLGEAVLRAIAGLDPPSES